MCVVSKNIPNRGSGVVVAAGVDDVSSKIQVDQQALGQVNGRIRFGAVNRVGQGIYRGVVLDLYRRVILDDRDGVGNCSSAVLAQPTGTAKASTAKKAIQRVNLM